MDTAEPVVVLTPELRRSNAKLGILLGLVVVLITVVFMAVFSINGLPKDPKEWARIKQEESALKAEAGDSNGLGEAGKETNVKATATAGETR